MLKNGKSLDFKRLSGIEKVHRNSFRITVDLWRRRRDSNPRYPYGVYTISNRARSTGLRDFSIAVKLKTIQFSLSTIANARGKVKSDFAAREDFFGFFQLSSRSPF